jgi:hypothetical protein
VVSQEVSWLNDWDEAAKHPARTIAFIFLSGFVSCGLIGYSASGAASAGE